MWPSVAPGETHQRDIDSDDENGVRGGLRARHPCRDRDARGLRRVERGRCAAKRHSWSDLLAAGGRGPARRRPVAALVAARQQSSARRCLRSPSCFLFGTGVREVPIGNERVEVLRTLALRRLPQVERRRGLLAAARSTSERCAWPPWRCSSAPAPARIWISPRLLSFDDDAEVRRVAHQAIDAPAHCSARRRVSAHDEKAERAPAWPARRARDVWCKGEAVSVGVQDRRGLLWSRYLVHGDRRGRRGADSRRLGRRHHAGRLGAGAAHGWRLDRGGAA